MLKNRVFYPILAVTLLIFGFAVSKMAFRTPSEVQKIYRATTPDVEPASPPTVETSSASESTTETPSRKVESPEPLAGRNPTFLEIRNGLKGYETKSWGDVMDPNLPRTDPFNVLERHKTTIANFLRESPAEQQADPEFQKGIEVLFSETYLNHLQGGATHNELANVLFGEVAKITGEDMSHLRNPSERSFRKYFPKGSHEDHEPEMRARLTSLLQKHGGDSAEALSEFTEDRRAEVWFATRGQKYNSLRDIDNSVNIDWVREVRAAALGVPAAEAMDMDVAAPLPEPHTMAENDTTDTTSAPQVSSDPPILDVRNAAQADGDSSTEETLPASLPRPPQIPSASQLLATDAEVEVSLREHFSPQRFTRAISTLDQYGPEEGLRRIKQSDPEVAKHIERMIHPPQEQTGDR